MITTRAGNTIIASMRVRDCTIMKVEQRFSPRHGGYIVGVVAEIPSVWITLRRWHYFGLNMGEANPCPETVMSKLLYRKVDVRIQQVIRAADKLVWEYNFINLPEAQGDYQLGDGGHG